MIEVKPYRPAWRKQLMELWNATFAGRRHFVPLDRDSFRRRIECPTGDPIDPRFLQVAIAGDEVLGFAHGGLWDAELGAQILPERVLAGPLGYLGVVLVGESHRRQGLGRRLVEGVGAVARGVGGPDTPLVVDGRMFNPHYGNFLAPVPPLWGTTEGISVPESDTAARAFLGSLGFQEITTAWSLTLDLSQDAPARPDATPSNMELVETENYLPDLGTGEGMGFAAPNESRTWVLAVGDSQVGYLVAYPLAAGGPPPGDPRPWAIFSLELSDEVRGQGLGRWLTVHVLAELAARGVPEVETLVLPEEAAAAARLYEGFGFQRRAAWVIFQ